MVKRRAFDKLRVGRIAQRRAPADTDGPGYAHSGQRQGVAVGVSPPWFADPSFSSARIGSLSVTTWSGVPGGCRDLHEDIEVRPRPPVVCWGPAQMSCDP